MWSEGLGVVSVVTGSGREWEGALPCLHCTALHWALGPLHMTGEHCTGSTALAALHMTGRTTLDSSAHSPWPLAEQRLTKPKSHLLIGIRRGSTPVSTVSTQLHPSPPHLHIRTLHRASIMLHHPSRRIPLPSSGP